MKNYIFFDLETNGLDLKKSAIMQITIINIYGSIIYNKYVYPHDNKIEATQIHGIDENTLRINNAVNINQMCTDIKRILRDFYDRQDIYWVAYNNFGFDQIILENNFNIAGVKMAFNWYFVDLYPLVKEIHPEIKPNFKLSTVYRMIVEKDGNINFHSSLDDTKCLFEIFKKLNNHEDKLEKYTRSLFRECSIFKDPLTSLSGYSSGMKLENKNIGNIGDLYEIYKYCNYDKETTKEYFRNNLNIYSNFHINNMIKQMENIKYIY